MASINKNKWGKCWYWDHNAELFRVLRICHRNSDQMLSRKKKSFIMYCGEKQTKASISRKEEDTYGQYSCWKRPGGDRRAEWISCVGTYNTTWQQCREQRSVLVRITEETLKWFKGCFRRVGWQTHYIWYAQALPVHSISVSFNSFFPFLPLFRALPETTVVRNTHFVPTHTKTYFSL